MRPKSSFTAKEQYTTPRSPTLTQSLMRSTQWPSTRTGVVGHGPFAFRMIPATQVDRAGADRPTNPSLHLHASRFIGHWQQRQHRSALRSRNGIVTPQPGHGAVSAVPMGHTSLNHRHTHSKYSTALHSSAFFSFNRHSPVPEEARPAAAAAAQPCQMSRCKGLLADNDETRAPTPL